MSLVTVEEELGNAVFAPLTSCTLLTRQSASVLKVGVPCASRSLQRQAGLKCYSKNSGLIQLILLVKTSLSLKYLSIERVKPQN